MHIHKYRYKCIHINYIYIHTVDLNKIEYCDFFFKKVKREHFIHSILCKYKKVSL